MFFSIQNLSPNFVPETLKMKTRQQLPTHLNVVVAEGKTNSFLKEIGNEVALQTTNSTLRVLILLRLFYD